MNENHIHADGRVLLLPLNGHYAVALRRSTVSARAGSATIGAL